MALLAGGASVNAAFPDNVNGCGWAALHFAASAGRANTGAAMLDGGVAVGARTMDEFGATPLLFATQKGHAAVIPALLEGAPTVSGKSVMGERYSSDNFKDCLLYNTHMLTSCAGYRKSN